MLNELMLIGRSVEAWGEKVPEGKYFRLQPNPWGDDNTARLLATLDADGRATVAKFADQPDFYNFTWPGPNQGTALTFKIHDGTNDPLRTRMAKQLQRAQKRHRELADMLPDEPPFDRLHELADRLDAACNEEDGSRDALVAAIEAAAGGRAEFMANNCYVSLELGGCDTPVQSDAFFDEFRKQLCPASGGGGDTDLFGNPLEILDPKAGLSHNVPGVGTTYLYSRNEDNECYARYGRNSVDACLLGDTSRQRLHDIVRFVMSESRMATKDRPGGWWYVGGRSSSGSEYTDIVLTSLHPPDTLLETGSGVAPDEWDRRITAVVQSLRKQSQNANGVQGRVVFIRKLKGPTQFRAANSVGLSDLAAAVEDWRAGMLNGPTFFPRMNRGYDRLSLYGVYKDINKKWSCGIDGVRPVGDGDTVTLPVVYSLLLGDPGAVAAVARRYAANVVPMLIRSFALTQKTGRVRGFPDDFYRLVPLGNLLLHKMGHRLNHDGGGRMDNWAFLLGQVLNRANWLHRTYFEARSFRPPPLLLGQRHVQAAYNTPRSAFANFWRAFQPSLNWLESPDRNGAFEGMTMGFRSLVSRLLLQTHGELPPTANPADVILVAMGYLYYEKRVAPATDKPSEAAEEVTE